MEVLIKYRFWPQIPVSDLIDLRWGLGVWISNKLAKDASVVVLGNHTLRTAAFKCIKLTVC